MSRLLGIAKVNDCYLISDEVYRYLVDDAEVSGKSLSEIDEEFPSLRGDSSAITIDGFSKCLNITGWRLGYAIADKDVIAAMTGIQSQMSGPPSTLIQDIVASAWDELEGTGFEAYRDRIDLLCRIEKFRKHRPKGGFYFYLPIDARWQDTKTLCSYMLEKYSIAITPGDDYGVERTVRISAAAVTADELKDILPALEEI